MNTLIIFQTDSNVQTLLDGHQLPKPDEGVEQVPGHGFHVMTAEMTVKKSPKGPSIGNAQEIYAAIVKFCKSVLEDVQNDLVEVQLIFIFHQTNKTIARNIINACAWVKASNILWELAKDANKALSVKKITLLSCESGTDKVVKPPYRKGLKPAIEQATGMRSIIASAFKTKLAPPLPSGGTLYPSVVTFSTGNPDRGGIVMDPFHVEFRDLDGEFDENGAWSYNDPDNHDPEGTDSKGTIYDDNEGSGSNTETLAAGAHVNLMGYHP